MYSALSTFLRICLVCVLFAQLGTAARIDVRASGTESDTPQPTGFAINPLKGPGLCLTAASNSNGAAVTVQNCNGGSGQVWTFTGGTFRTFGGGKCLDVTNGSTANGNLIQIYGCSSGNPSQQFAYTGDNRIAWNPKGECLDLTNGSTSPGNRIQMWKCTDNDNNQVWFI